MKLIVDANELFSALIAKGRGKQTKKLDLLFSDDVELFSPALLFRELEKNRELIKRKAGFSDQDMETLIEILKLRIKVIPADTVLTALEKAKEICPQLKDAPYFAAALVLNCPLWSGDKKLKEQSIVRVLNTKELVELFGL